MVNERSITLGDAKAALKRRVNTDPYDPLNYDTRWRIVDIRDGTVVDQADWIGDTKRPAKIQATAAKLKQAAKLLEAAAKMKTLKGCALKEQEAHAILSRLRYAGEID
ncbi:hypothetical protein HOU00_gp198 [Caulobacter phage CcrPW]|uniref:Uncharacterized protein n=1 Tax=Caulobacter phage CcrPW TaxID=2283271 RepID=A0A385EDN3_9CAUD|nr:hypothetical protein HOU00_gp198 [Caulobacter phage CcrPW]AXQ68927.1 hypothetical protein CcrPW_gp388c [Caulobacter phage CcrPW]